MELSEKAKEMRNAYQREYRRRNPEKFKRYNTDFWERQALLASIPDDLEKCPVCQKPLDPEEQKLKFCSAECKEKFFHNMNKGFQMIIR